MENDDLESAVPPRTGATAWLLRRWARYGTWLLPVYLRLRGLMPWISLAMGTVTVVLFRRGLWYMRFVVAYLALVWLITVALATLTRGEALGSRSQVARKVSEFIAQALIQESLFFLLPFYVASSVLSSSHLVFLVLLGIGILVSTFDPLFDRWVRDDPATGAVFYVFSLFACLNFILPVATGMRNVRAVFLSAVLAAALTPPMLEPWRNMIRPRGLVRSMLLILLTSGVVYVTVPAIPPAPIKVVKATFARGIDMVRREPLEPLPAELERHALARLIAWTPIFAPLGIKEPVVHIWRHDGVEMDRIVLDPIRGGRESGFRTWSVKGNFGADPLGRWTVDVRTASGQLMGRLSLRVVPDRQ